MRMIDADAVCKDCNRTYLGEGYCKYCSIYKMPTIDAVPVVRCKDCKFFDTTEMCNCGFTNLYLREQEDFCSYGERRDTACDACDLTRYTDAEAER